MAIYSAAQDTSILGTPPRKPDFLRVFYIMCRNRVSGHSEDPAACQAPLAFNLGSAISRPGVFTESGSFKVLPYYPP